MKKAAALVMASFYLLLTAGTYLCFLHCTAKQLAGGHQMSMSLKQKGHHKGCSGNKEGDCCKKHGSYTIKENLKPAAAFEANLAAVPLNYFISFDTLFQLSPDYVVLWPNSNAPPGQSGKNISIRFRSLQI